MDEFESDSDSDYDETESEEIVGYRNAITTSDRQIMISYEKAFKILIQLLVACFQTVKD